CSEAVLCAFNLAHAPHLHQQQNKAKLAKFGSTLYGGPCCMAGVSLSGSAAPPPCGVTHPFFMIFLVETKGRE
ncbi:hypothetical protein, partial [Staphylococcus aureus]